MKQVLTAVASNRSMTDIDCQNPLLYLIALSELFFIRQSSPASSLALSYVDDFSLEELHSLREQTEVMFFGSAIEVLKELPKNCYNCLDGMFTTIPHVSDNLRAFLKKLLSYCDQETLDGHALVGLCLFYNIPIAADISIWQDVILLCLNKNYSHVPVNFWN